MITWLMDLPTKFSSVCCIKHRLSVRHHKPTLETGFELIIPTWLLHTKNPRCQTPCFDSPVQQILKFCVSRSTGRHHMTAEHPGWSINIEYCDRLIWRRVAQSIYSEPGIFFAISAPAAFNKFASKTRIAVCDLLVTNTKRRRDAAFYRTLKIRDLFCVYPL